MPISHDLFLKYNCACAYILYVKIVKLGTNIEFHEL